MSFSSEQRDILSSKDKNNDDIYLIYQYFIHSNEDRNKEIKYCLRRNIELGLFKKIILLNEKIYSADELGLSEEQMDSITQININHRLKYSSVFIRTRLMKLQGYVVFCNSDIFFDESILQIRKSSLSTSKMVYTLLRYEYDINKPLNKSKIFTYNNAPRSDSQDVWIFHTKTLNITTNLIKQTNFMLGLPGCDNKITYVFHSNGYSCVNEPYIIKTYHYHSTQIRNYTSKERIPSPYLLVVPIIR